MKALRVRSSRARLAMAAGATALVACGTTLTSLLVVREAPPRLDPIRMPHARHAEAKVACVVCHEAAYDATDLSARLVPKEAKCLECHKAEKESGNCGFCHTDASLARPLEPRQAPLRIDHAAHLERVDEDCSRCHTALSDRGRPPEGPAMEMKACLSCHEHEKEYDEGRCGTCHVDLRRDPRLPGLAFEHGGDFLHGHALPARSGDASCSTCHGATFCSDCHSQTVGLAVETRLPERVDRSFLHRGDFVARHASEARADSRTCATCHTPASCEGCHVAEGLSPLSANPRDPHPSGWAWPGSTPFHGDAARRNVSSCAPCHDQGAASICVDCHRVGGVGGDPHPAGFTRRHPASEIGGNGTCLACH